MLKPIGITGNVIKVTDWNRIVTDVEDYEFPPEGEHKDVLEVVERRESIVHGPPVGDPERYRKIEIRLVFYEPLPIAESFDYEDRIQQWRPELD